MDDTNTTVIIAGLMVAVVVCTIALMVLAIDHIRHANRMELETHIQDGSAQMIALEWDRRLKFETDVRDMRSPIEGGLQKRPGAN